VLSVNDYEDGVVVVVVAYGTSQKVDRLESGEFAIRKMSNKAAYEMAGLSFDTKFDLRHTVDLPWNDTFFAIPPIQSHGQTPKLGSLHVTMLRVVQAALG
jgi:hypothetical protein